jgi:ketosteroid isomerase-like protein
LAAPLTRAAVATMLDPENKRQRAALRTTDALRISRKLRASAMPPRSSSLCASNMGDTKIQTIRGIDEAFGRGDVDAILDTPFDDVDWAMEPEGSGPWDGSRRGKGEVANSFKALVDNVEVTELAPLDFASNETDVMVVIRYSVRVPATGKAGAMTVHHWWLIRYDKIYFVRGTEDTALTNCLLSAD